ncbi:MAG: glycosyltransferase family 1 protein [Flavobacterium sp.]|uniref:glycosyltransferase family 4 protein n=1 Tax=Flavobacterium sp. TaxID=239 RepID=UPI00121DDF8B|nr:glycosyltransferase [Flavobacterium sp.]RZJ66090.1 MAG: glycosyltransferase family 1 protein [Flavobacterium sp.]
MRFAIITHVPHKLSNGRLAAYGPYVREMNIWGSHVDMIEIVAPFEDGFPDAIDIEYDHPKIIFRKIPAFDVISSSAKIKVLFKLPKIVWRIATAMRKADHVHLRCPGNIGLIGCFVQILFPSKPKTAKYAGNWDPKSKQPLSYRLQKLILNNAFLTRNMKVLVYGKWEGSSPNIQPFFTATYNNSDRDRIFERNHHGPLRLLFVGTLSPGKQPLYALKIAERLHDLGVETSLDFYGEGKMRDSLETYISEKGLQDVVRLMGNQNEMTVRGAYKSAHFVLLPSLSEGWPKVLAEAMFWGCVPVATRISCVPFMLGNGGRGILMTEDLEKDSKAVLQMYRDAEEYKVISENASEWSRQYTLDVFGNEIRKMLESGKIRD